MAYPKDRGNSFLLTECWNRSHLFPLFFSSKLSVEWGKSKCRLSEQDKISVLLDLKETTEGLCLYYFFKETA